MFGADALPMKVRCDSEEARSCPKSPLCPTPGQSVQRGAHRGHCLSWGTGPGGRDALSASLPKAQGPGGGSGLTERGHHNAPGGLQTLTVEETVVEGMGFGGRGVDDTVRDRKTHLRGR